MIYYGTESPTALLTPESCNLYPVKPSIHKLHTWYPACPSHYTAGDKFQVRSLDLLSLSQNYKYYRLKPQLLLPYFEYCSDVLCHS